MSCENCQRLEQALLQANAAAGEAVHLLKEWCDRKQWGMRGMRSDTGHLGLCSFQGGSPEECHVCGTTVRTINLLNSTTAGTSLLRELEQLRADAAIGVAWRLDSSLEKWFPFTAEELEQLRKERDELRAVLLRCRDTVGIYISCAGHHSDGDDPCPRCEIASQIKKVLSTT